MVKKILLAATVMVFGMSVFAGPTFAAPMAEWQTADPLAVDEDGDEEGGDTEVFSVVNQTGEAIDEIYIEAADETEWGDDLTGEESLGDGETLELHYEAEGDDAEAAAYDMMIVWAEGYEDGTKEDVWEDLDLDGAHKVTLEYDWEEHHPTATVE